MTETTELAELPPKETALAVYCKPRGLEPWLEKIRAEVTGHVPDLKTKKGREAIASMAFKVRKSKTALDNLGKKLVDDLKDVPKRIDAERKRMRDTLDALADEVRKPLTEWEQAEEARQQRHLDGIEWFRLRADENRDLDADELRTSIEQVTGRTVDTSWEEYESEAHRVKARALEALTQALAAREKADAEQAELARLRAAEAEREQKEREERIAREAAEQAQREADARAQAEREAVIRREQEAKAAADRRELELKLQAEQAEKAAAQAKADKLAAEQRAEQDRIAGIEREKQAAEAARQAEIKRQADAKAAEEAEAARREADKAHKGKVNRAALSAFVQGGMTEECAKLAVTLIAKGEIPAIKISY
jgi:colicin import membrane protein